jgi:predicted nucleic acid-binding protein
MTEPRFDLDANVFIYAIEGSADIAESLHGFFALLRAGRGIGITSELTIAEVLAKADPVQRLNYLNLIVSSRVFDLRPISREILIETADYRAASRMPKLPDAIHVVTAIHAGCRTILSADARLQVPEGYSIVKPEPANLLRLMRELS